MRIGSVGLGHEPDADGVESRLSWIWEDMLREGFASDD